MFWKKMMDNGERLVKLSAADVALLVKLREVTGLDAEQNVHASLQHYAEIHQVTNGD